MESKKRPVIKTYRDLHVYTKSFEFAMDIFKLTSEFPKEEKYSLVNQMRRSSRSISANIAEGWAKRKYENVFKRHLIDAVGSCVEMKVWLDFALECEYIYSDKYTDVISGYDEVGKMLHSLIDRWVSF